MAKKDEPLGFDILERADSLFDGISDLTLLVLKAHLLLEEELYNQLRRLFPSPEQYDRLNLRFIQNIMLARAFCIRRTAEGQPIEHVELCWDALEALNTFRNRLAHNLEPGDVNNLLARLQLTQPQPLSIDDPELVSKLNIPIGFLLQFVSSLIAFSSFDIAVHPLPAAGPNTFDVE
ncbi:MULTISPECIES: hypothetical protein [unclassified Bradyrhizobium]|uniref:hypothetical protein n=1 Tax=unclassified Bradyrhizobium TaxID=2631580 RepID=UPI002915F58B|nr:MULTISPECIES: hypothetical protein [unclassified Bradyrhizobium]